MQPKEIRDVPETVLAPTEPLWDEQEVIEPVAEESAPWRSVRARRAPEKFTLLTTWQRNVLLLDNDEPKTYTKAIIGPESEKWFGAMKSEIESMHDNQVWNLVDPIEGVRPVECKWIFKKKIDMDGNVTSIKRDWWRKGLNRFKVLIMMKHFLPSQC